MLGVLVVLPEWLGPGLLGLVTCISFHELHLSGLCRHQQGGCALCVSLLAAQVPGRLPAGKLPRHHHVTQLKLLHATDTATTAAAAAADIKAAKTLAAAKAAKADEDKQKNAADVYSNIGDTSDEDMDLEWKAFKERQKQRDLKRNIAGAKHI